MIDGNNTNELQVFSVKYINPAINDALERCSPLLAHTLKNNLQFVDGHTTYTFPLKVYPNQSNKWIPGVGADLDTTVSQQYINGVLNWKYFAEVMNTSLEELTISQGQRGHQDLIVDKIMGSAADVARTMAQSLYESSDVNPLQVEGLADITAASGISYAGINNTMFTDDQIYLPYFYTGSSITYNMFADMQANLTSRITYTGDNRIGRDLVAYCNPSVYIATLALFQGQQRYLMNDNADNVGFRSIDVNGVPLYLDSYCPGSGNGTADNFLYMIPKRNVLKIWYKYGFGDRRSPIDSTEKVYATNQEMIRKFWSMGLACVNRRLIAVAKTLDPAA